MNSYKELRNRFIYLKPCYRDNWVRAELILISHRLRKLDSQIGIGYQKNKFESVLKQWVFIAIMWIIIVCLR